ncbi:MAG: hypothetical protein GF399_09155 [Candidatus Coatesbacteria bacterium]|nr:hypothetical protein [Candidatus Coatesbacteria bacterium]
MKRYTFILFIILACILLACDNSVLTIPESDIVHTTYEEILNIALKELTDRQLYEEGEPYKLGEIACNLNTDGRSYGWEIIITVIDSYYMKYTGDIIMEFNEVQNSNLIEPDGIINTPDLVNIILDVYNDIAMPVNVYMCSESAYYENPHWLIRDISIYDANSILYREYLGNEGYQYVHFRRYMETPYIYGKTMILLNTGSYHTFDFWDGEPDNTSFYYEYYYYSDWGEFEQFYESRLELVDGYMQNNSYTVFAQYEYELFDGYKNYYYYGSDTFTAELVDTEYGAWMEGVVAVDAYTGEIVYCGPVIE